MTPSLEQREKMKKDLLRIVDANLNRSREGLRVCEEVVRFALQDARLTSEFKALRHKVSRSIKRFPGLSKKSLLECRESLSDVGRRPIIKAKRKNCQDIFFANIQRTKEALRVLEEFSNILNRSLSSYFAKLRFQVYELEKKTIARF